MSGSEGRRVELLERTTVYDGHYRVERLRLRHEKVKGGLSDPLSREVFERGHAASLLPYDPERDAVVLVEQFRIGPYALGESAWKLEIPAGLIDGDEAPEAVARRECEEETGCRSDRTEFIGRFFVSAGAVTETNSLFCGRVDSRQAQPVGGVDKGEDIKVIVRPWGEIARALEEGRIDIASAAIALQWLAIHRDRLRRAWLGGS
jgi:ADP-ribose pyrophosphatase